jgi:hypothetical protein
MEGQGGQSCARRKRAVRRALLYMAIPDAGQRIARRT